MNTLTPATKPAILSPSPQKRPTVTFCVLAYRIARPYSVTVLFCGGGSARGRASVLRV